MPSDIAVTPLTVTAPDGRELQVVVGGPADGMPLVFHDGTPAAAAVPYGPAIADAADRGLRLVIYARPGYAKSTPHPGRAVCDVASDVTAILDELGAEQFVTAGASGGGPHALACAALLPGRCRGAASIAGVAPWGAKGLDWLAGMAAENVAEFGAALAGEAELTAFLTAAAAELADITADQVNDSLGGLVSEVDKAAVTGEYASHLAATFRAAVSTGIAGWRDDDLAFARDWGFTLADAAPVTIWQGGQDMMVPFAHGEWLASQLPGARVHLMPEEGHLSIQVSQFGAILDDLLSVADVG